MLDCTADYLVTPCVGVWIETKLRKPGMQISYKVTPCVGVWIETVDFTEAQEVTGVTPCVGVWIETQLFEWEFNRDIGHTLRGCVD